ADGQGKALRHCYLPGPGDDRIGLAQAHGMPPMQAVGWQRDPGWRVVLASLLDHMAGLPELPAPAMQAVQALKQRLDTEPDAIEAQADAVLADNDGVDAAAAPFIM